MKVLIVSWFFPSHNLIGALRVGKFAKFLQDKGHDVRVLTADYKSDNMSLSLEIPEENVIRTKWVDMDQVIHPFSRGKKTRSATPDQPVKNDTGSRRIDWLKIRRWIGFHYNNFFFTPDRYNGWFPFAIRGAKELFKSWRPDMIVASGPPFISMFIASSLSRSFNIPWIAEYRDRWTEDPYQEIPGWKHYLNVMLEKFLLKTVSGIITVSKPWANTYQEKYDCDAVTVYNGYDPDDFAVKNTKQEFHNSCLTILYSGSIYEYKRDPTALFKAIKIGSFSPKDVQVVFQGLPNPYIIECAEKERAFDFVQIKPKVDYKIAIQAMRGADVLLLLQWNNPKEQGNVPAKLFEYFACERPILGLGYEGGVPANLIRENKAGLYSNDPEIIAKQLQAWLDEKKQTGCVKGLDPKIKMKFDRKEQFEKAERFISVQYQKFHSSPQLLITVDVEEEFDWSAPFSRENRQTEAMKHLHLAHDIIKKYGFKPIYLVDYPILEDSFSVSLFKKWLKAGECEIGAQLHPWVTPPYEEEVNTYNSFAGNLPFNLEYQKLKNLRDKIKVQFGIYPKYYRAGRYGFGKNTAKILKSLGFEIDLSFAPHTSFAVEGGPDYRDMPDHPFWLDEEKKLKEIPLTKNFTGLLNSIGKYLYPIIDHQWFKKLRFPGIFARLGLLNRVNLSPEGSTLKECLELTKTRLKKGQKIFVYSFHSSSLLIGANDYVKNEGDLKGFLNHIEQYCTFFRFEIDDSNETR